MDVHQLAFLAGQPSATLKNRDHFLGLPKRGLAFLLANVMFWQPLWAQADGIVVSAPGTTLGQAGNGVPIVNIAAPNASGLSHNQFQDYNVGTNGVILNNATGRTQSTQLGGIILGNSNLNGRAASTILNEVNGGSPSQLRGYTEVAGQSAHVIVANPYGITCNGCGFINTPQATLTTGKTVLTNGQVSGYQVDGGSVSIEGAGLNANNIDRFEIITRSAKLNAEIQAKNLAIIAGANDVDAKTLKATARAADLATAPQLAIDSSALGGMYAGAIKLVGTEAGVGVKLDGKMVASGGDIQLDANGHLSMVDTAATGAVTVKAQSLEAKGPVYAGTTLDVTTQGDLTSQNNLVAKDRITLSSGGQLTNNGIIEAGVNADNSRNASGDVSLSAQNVNNAGKGVIASRDLKITATQVLNNNTGAISGAATTKLVAASLNNLQGQVTGNLGLSIDLSGALDNQGGILGSGGALTLNAASLDNRAAGTVLASGGSLTATIRDVVDNRDQGKLRATGAIELAAGSLDNRGGSVAGKDQLTLRSASADNRGGLIQADQDVQLLVDQLDNRDKGNLLGKAALRYEGTRLDNSGGLLSATGPVTLKAQEVVNVQGRIASQNNLTATIETLNQQGGALVAQGALLLTGKSLDNRNGGTVASIQGLTLNVDQIDNRAGELSSTSSKVKLSAQRLDNSDGGKLLAETDLALTVAQVINQTKGRLFAKGSASLVGTSLDNTGGTFSSLNAVDIRLDGALLNNTGLLSSEGALSLKTGSLDNSRGQLGSAGDLSIDSLGALLNQGGSILTDHGLSLTSSRLDNSQTGRISGLGATRVTTGDFDNSQDGGLTSDDRLDLTATQVNNASGRIASGKDLTANVTGLDQQGGELFSKTNLSLDLNNGQLNNQGGLINGPVLVLNSLKGVNNQGGEISSAQAFTLAAESLDNSNGKLLSNQGLTLRIEQALSNVKGLISAAALDSRSASLDNSQGQISSRGLADVAVRGAFTNQNGQLIAQGNLSLTGNSLDNRQNGLVGATKALKLNVDQVDNRAGELSSNADIAITASRLDNRDGGKVLAETSLTLNSAQLLNGNQGLLKGKTGLSLDGQILDNTHGLLISGQDSRITLTGDLDNSQGLISSEGQLDVSAAKLSNTAGSLSSAGTLTANASAALVNQGGRLVSDSGITVNSASLDNSTQGVISGKGAVGVTTGAFDNSAGSLTSADSLTLTAGQVSNQGGRIGSDKALTANVTGLDQQGGKLFSNSALTLDLNHGQLNNQNGLINAPLLVLNNLKGVNNQGGEISSAQAFTLAADSLDNSNGKLLSNQAVTLRVNQALTNLKGLIAASALDIRAASLDSSNGGEVSAQGDIDLSVSSLTQNGGRLLSDQAIRLDLAGGDLDNRNGLLNAKGPLTLDNLRDLNNQNGELSSSQSFNVVGRNLDNSNGKLISNNRLGVTGNSLINQGGLISGWQGLSVTGSSLDNRNSGTLSSRSGNLDVTLSGALLNGNMGALVSQQTLTVNADSLDNSAGILSSGAEQKLTVAGLLNNIQGGSIDSGADLSLQAMTLDNAGSISAQQAIGFTGTRLDNSAGTLTGNGAVTLDLLGALINNSGKLASAGPLVISRSSQISNQGGQLVSQGLLSLLTGSLDNSNRGTVAANGNLQITSTGAVQNNADGLIYSQTGDLTVNAASLANGKGSLQGQGALSLTVAGDIDNQSGKLIAQNGNLTASAANLDNRGGTLSSLKGALETRIVGVLKNGYDLNNNRQGGIIQGQRLNLSALGGIDNYGGRISAQSGDTLITTADFDNRNGGVYAKGLVQVTGNNFDNSGDNDGQIAGQRIDLSLNGALNNRLGIIESDSTLSVRAASLDNQTGQLRALGTSGKTDFQIGGLFDNRNGKLETANSDLTLNVGGFQNQGGSLQHVGDGTFDIATVNLLNAGGNVTTRGGLTLTADNWTNSSVIEAGRLTVNVGTLNQTAGGQLLAVTSLTGSGGNWNNDGLIASDGTASLNLTGSYGGNGRYSTQGTLGLNAASLSLGSAGSIAGGADTTINVAGTLGNYGRITSAARLDVTAAAINNYGTLGSNAALRLSTPALLNENGLIFSAGDSNLQVNSFTNHAAQLYSLGAVSIGGYGGAAQATQVSNISGGLESASRFTVNAATFENRTESFSLGRTLVSGAIAVQCLDCSGDHYDLNYVAREVFEGRDNDTSASATLTAGGDFVFKGGSFLNSKSTISAGGSIDIQANDLKNVGAVGGTIERTRVYRTGSITDGTANRSMPWVVAYNQRNNPYFPYVYYVNGSGGLSLAVPTSATRREGGRDGETIRYVKLTDTVTGAVVNNTLSGYAYQNIPQSAYDRNNLVALPGQLQQYSLTSDTEVTKDGTGTGSGRSAIIQAAGKVSITATQSLDNSVIHQDYAVSTGPNQVQETRVSGMGAPVAIRLSAQLPPDLAQQQVNPLALPGFSLPSGQNGLFRLNGQGSSAQQPDQVNAAVQNLSIGSGIQHQQATSNAQGRSLQLADDAQGKAQLEQMTRQGTGADVGGSVVNVIAPLSNPADLIAPVSGAGRNRVVGLPDTSGRSAPHKYLIETNPVLTDLKQFMSSDYLLAGLGYNPDESAKRLGDGFYEQKLIQQAVTARTGQRFIDGQTSDEALYKYLMDNAIQSKQELNLAVGVSLSSQQVAALTHDIVWLEEHEVNGEKVLVPVLYMAQATGRLAPNGALIQGSDVTLIAGKDLNNSGTLRASNNLLASAGSDLSNAGLVEAGSRLDLLAGNNIVNKSGAIISGRDVSLSATRGDVLNQRDVTHLDSSYGGGTQHRDILDSAARIEASNNLSIGAGRDINSNGSVLSSGADMKLGAGRDINVNAIAERTTDARGGSYLSQQITQHGATVTAGRDLSVSAGRDISAIAGTLESKRDMALAAGEDIHLESAANESEFASRSKKKTLETRSVSQQSTELKAGRDISIAAGKDLDVIASRITAGGDVALDAAQDMTIASAKDESSYYYSKKSKGSFGRSSSKQVESYDSTNVASVVEAGKDLTINASKGADGAMNINGGRDVTIIGSQLKAHDDLMVAGQGDVAVLSGVEEHGSYSKKTKSGFLGLSKSGKSQLKTTASQVGSELEAGNDVVVAAGNDIRLRASEATAGNDVELHAGVVNKDGDINLVSANDTAYSRSEQYKKKTGLSVSGGFISFSSAKAAGKEAQSSTSVGSQVVADRDASLQAERDINISGSGVKAGRNVALNAGRDVNVVAAQNSSAEQDWKKDKRAGIGVSGDDNGVSMFIGAERTKEKNRLEQQTAAASQISAGQDLAINAKRDINQVGSDLKASHDINLAAGRNINIDAARESQLIEQQRESERNGLGMTLNHNYGNTKNAVSGAGKGEDNVSKGSSTLKAVDSVGQFLSGPTADVKFGNSKQSNSQQVVEQTNRSSTLSAGNDLNLSAGNDVQVRGAQLDAGRDINIKGRDLVLDAAKGSVSQETRESQSWGGIHGGTSGGFKVGVGGSHGVASGDSSQGTSTVTQLGAGRDVNLQASNDLNLIGTQVKAGRDIDLKAGNELNIRSAQNGYSSENNRSSGGGEVGLTFGSEGVGVYASVSLGKGNLEREGERQQEAYLYAGDRLGFTSGKDTNVSGATLRGDEVVGRVGGDLNVSSAADTGTVKGKEFDINVTVTVGPGAGVSGSVGYGATTGKTNWVDQQTSITGKEKVDIRTENHTQIDGALIAADNGNLKLDTGTLGFSDIAGKDKEHGYYLNVGGSYNQSGSGGTAQDPSQAGKGEEGKTGWSVSGWNYEKDREQIVRATVGAGDIIVRKDAETGGDSTQGLNRDVGKAYEVTKDKESRTDLYASGTSVGAVLDPGKTYDQWKRNVSLYGENSEEAFRSLQQLLITMEFLTKNINDLDMASRVANNAINLNRTLLYLSSKDQAKREEAVRYLLVGAKTDQLDARAKELVSGLADMAGRDPARAILFMGLIASLENPQPPQGAAQQSFVPVAIGGALVFGMAATLLAAGAATPENQARMSEAINSIIHEASERSSKVMTDLQVRLAVELVKVYYGTTFPVHLLDDESRALVNPILEGQGSNPASGGYGAGGQPTTATTTGGSRIAESPSGSYTNPSVDNTSLGAVYSLPGGQSVSDFESSLVRLPSGERVAIVKPAAKAIADSLGWAKDNRLSRINDRDVYVGTDGFLYAVDTQHGRFEKVNSRNGAHMGEVQFDLTAVKNSKDDSGKHDLRVK